MDKISLPFRILLAVFVVFAVVWFLVLRPKPAGLRRNAAIALANVRARGHHGETQEAPAVDQKR